MKRLPAVADQFYAGDPAVLASDLKRLVPDLPAAQKKRALAVVSPHAGYVYSGAVAGETFSRVQIPEDVVVMGPNHHGHGEPVALARSGIWRMPLGDVALNEDLAACLLAESGLIVEDEAAHRFEHSLEVQVPFLQFLQKDLHLTPLVISHISYKACVEIGRALAAGIREYGRPVLIVASTDMTHYESRATATDKDMLAIARLEALDPAGLYDTVIGKKISMCGVMPTTVALVAAIELGATKGELVRYTDSGAVSGDVGQVVGYAGMIVS